MENENETRHFGHAVGTWFYGCDVCNPTDVNFEVSVSPTPQSVEDTSWSGASKIFIQEYIATSKKFDGAINKAIDTARLDGKVYALLDAAEDFKAYYSGLSITPEFVIEWLEARAKAIENDDTKD